MAICAREAVVYVCLNDLLQQLQCIAVDAHVLQAALLHGGVAHPARSPFAAGTDAAHLNGVTRPLMVWPEMSTFHTPPAAMAAVLIRRLLTNRLKPVTPDSGSTQRSLPCVAHKGVHVVRGQHVSSV